MTIPQSALPIEEIVKYPLPGTAIPGAFAFSPDDSLIAYLFSPDASLTRQLYLFDAKTGQQTLMANPSASGTTEESLSLQEALRRERQRQLELGVTQYAWAKLANRILVPLQDGLYVQDGLRAPLCKIVASDQAPALDAQFSPDGNQVAYAQAAELYVVSAKGGEPRQITFDARGTGKTHGLAEFIAQEEMKRNHGFWWSPDSQRIAFTEVDEGHIPVYRIVHQGKAAVGEEAQEDHPYPFAGQANARVRLAVVSAEGGEPVWMDRGTMKTFTLREFSGCPMAA